MSGSSPMIKPQGHLITNFILDMPLLADFIVQHNPITVPHYVTSWVPGQTPFSTNGPVFTMVGTYLCVVFGIKAVMANQPPLKLTTLFQIHNVFLCLASLLLFTLILEEVVPIIWQNGLFHAICAKEGYTSRLEFYYMLNYWYKYYEFMDTVFLALRKKPLRFLHVYHHAATAILTYVQVHARGTLAWAIASINLGIHVIMYYYYFMTSRGHRIWWKKYLTMMQITQFMVDIGIVLFAVYSRVATNYYQFLPNKGNCHGKIENGLFCGALILSYLGLFIDFYNQTFKAPQQKKKDARLANLADHK